MTSKKRILVIENAIDITGGLTSIMRSSVALTSLFTFVFVLPSKSRAKDFLTSAGFEVYDLPMVEVKKNVASLLLYFPALMKNTLSLFSILKITRADLIISNDFYNLLAPMYKLFNGKVPYIVYVRLLPSQFSKWLVGFWCFWHKHFATATVAVSHQVKSQLPYQRNVHHIPGELPAGDAPYAAPDQQRMLYLANYIPGKGQEHAIRSFASLSVKHPQWKLKFVGGDMGLEKNKVHKEKLKQLAIGLSADGKIEWGDFSANVHQEFADSAFVLNFSESESFSLTCLEAMFYGRPVIATKCGGPEEIIDHNINGLLVALRDTPSMAEAMDFMISHPEESSAMGRRAYRDVREKFSAKNTTEKLGQLYQSSI